MGHQVDMSGAVLLPDNGQMSPYRSDELSPFAQGAIKAAIAGPIYLVDQFGAKVLRLNNFVARYAAIAPKTLAWFIAEGERMLAAGLADTEEVGAAAWAARQAGLCLPDFPPVTLTVRDDGLIYTSEGRS